MKNRIKVYCDGGSRGNPGKAAYGFAVVGPTKTLHTESGYIGITTNNVAEYSAVIAALKWLSKNLNSIDSEILFVLDSELVVKQIKGLYKVKDTKLQELNKEVKRLAGTLKSSLIFTNVAREKNEIADGLVNEELDRS